MTPQHRRDFLEFLLTDITKEKRINIVKRTANLWKSMCEKKQLLQEEIARMQQQAREKGECLCLFLSLIQDLPPLPWT